MNEEILKLADLSNVKEGDTIWTIQKGFVKVLRVDPSTYRYPIITLNRSYTLDGKYYTDEKYPSAFIRNPFENIGFQERWMMVSETGIDWIKRKVFMHKNGFFIAWSLAETDDDVSVRVDSMYWQYAKEIEEPKELELTLEEIAEKFGVSVESIKIKK